jgi:putative transposase
MKPQFGILTNRAVLFGVAKRKKWGFSNFFAAISRFFTKARRTDCSVPELDHQAFTQKNNHLRSDPNVTGNTHRIEAGGLFGEVSVRIVGKPLAGNPKTSMLAPYSVVRSLANLSHPAAIAEIPELAPVKHVFVKASARLNNRAENSHQPTRERERRMRGFRDPGRTQAFLSSFSPIRQHFALKRHLLCASLYRKQLAVRFDAWHRFTELTLRVLSKGRALCAGASSKINVSKPDRNMPITEIAHAASFFDQSHFTRAFRDASGVTPTRF